ncbi:hypothetical protein [Streptomonospora wellingtoniae]|uniref:Uncharacterized protein n=1 Tax=Streptomonospora wellingtoniae TaxID=3075544 RepID=A0ABU2KZS5_9ACTN|nr:hypothetical protein [Streptomonospora sp. DSM 45055]MDT0304805.1 hypothetical protein [Streptomonospora sp. DSM 45055]
MYADVHLHDHVAMAEIELYSELLIAVAGADRRLTFEEIDIVLGVRAPVPEQARRCLPGPAAEPHCAG